MNYITRITEYKNIIMQHKLDKRRTFMKKLLYKIDFENEEQLLLILKPKEYQNAFDGKTFKIIKTLFTKEKILFENKQDNL